MANIELEIKELEQKREELKAAIQKLKAKEEVLATTMDEVVEIIKPRMCIGNGRKLCLAPNDTYYPHISSTEKAADKVQAYIDILNLCEYLNGKFEADGGKYTLDKECDVREIGWWTSHLFLSRKAVEYARTHFSQLFEIFYS